MKNTYTLSGTMSGETIIFHKKFHSRNKAIDYMIKYYSDHWVVNPQIDYIIENGKHNISYVCTNGNLFNVARKDA